MNDIERTARQLAGAAALSCLLLALAGCAARPAPQMADTQDPGEPEDALTLSQAQRGFVLCPVGSCPLNTLKQVLVVQRRAMAPAAAPPAPNGALRLTQVTPEYLIYEVLVAPDSPALRTAIAQVRSELPNASFHWLVLQADAPRLEAFRQVALAAGVPERSVTASVQKGVPDGKLPAVRPDGTIGTAQAPSPSTKLLAIRDSTIGTLETPPRRASTTGAPPAAAPAGGQQVGNAKDRERLAGTREVGNKRSLEPAGKARIDTARETLTKLVQRHADFDPTLADLYAADAEIVTRQRINGTDQVSTLTTGQIRAALRSIMPAAKASGSAPARFNELEVRDAGDTVTASAVRQSGTTKADVAWTLTDRDGRWLISREVATVR